jgi:RNA polymerase sigma-70 factor (ECF subfamily)
LAEDAAQEAFIKAWVNLDRFQPKSPFRNWVYRIATNAALDILRRQRGTVDIDDIPIASSHDGPENAAERRERDAIVQTAILNLSPASRVVLILREYEGLTYREISDTLKIPLGTVMSRLNYARNQLRLKLTTYLETT